MKKRIVSLLLAVFMFIAFVPLQADSAKGLAEGGSDDAAAGDACGENLFWSLENGVLTIRGSGGAFSFTTAAGAPWHDRVSEITGFVVEQGVTIVPAEACFGCTNLSSISIANSVTAIGTDAFGRCTSLRSVSIPDSVNVLGMYAFFGCENLTTATLGIGVNGLGYTVFGNTPSLTQINVASRNTYITSINGVVYNKDKSRLLYRPEANGESLTVPASVLGIAEGACMYSFSGTASQSLLKEIRFEGDAPGFGTNCFKGITANAYYPENNDTWTAAKRESCSGNLTWIPYEAESVKINIAACDISLSFESAQWTGSPIRPTVKVTAITYERQLEKHICPAFEGMAIEDIRATEVQAMFNAMHGAKETKIKVKNVLNMVFSQAIDDELITRNPLTSKSLRITGRSAKVTQPYSVEQMQFLAASVPRIQNPTDRAYLALQALHPLRLEETLGLTFDDIDLHSMTIHIERAVTHPDRNMPQIKTTKTEASKRTIDLVPEIADLLPLGKPSDFVFGGKQPLSYQQVKRMLERIRKEIGFDEPISPRRFRTTVLTDLYDSTKDIKLAQAAAGYTTSDMTLKHYVKGRMEKSNTAQPISKLYGLCDVTGV